MRPLTINIIGCGKLGKTLAKLITQQGSGHVLGIINATEASANASLAFIGSGRAYTTIHQLPVADIYFITTPDDRIEATALALQHSGKLTPQAIVVHCSGSLTSDVLSSVKASNASLCSIHPIKSFANPTLACETFRGTICTIEGEAAAVAVITSLFETLGGIVIPIQKENKGLYHAGGVMANNYLVTLHHHAVQCYVKAGIDQDTAIKVVSMLMTDALHNLNSLTHTQALTGPIQRGDTNTITKHIAALTAENHLAKTKAIYQTLGEGTLELTSHDQALKEKLSNSLNQCD